MSKKNNYDKISRLYNYMSNTFESRYRETALISFSASPGESLLEIGYGTGHSLLKLAESIGDSGHITGIDSSQSMFKISEKKLKRRGLVKRVSLKCGNVLQTHYKNNSFDGIFMSFTLETFTAESIILLMDKIQIWLKPGGRLCILCMSESSKKSLIYKIYLWSHKTFPSLVDCRPLKPEKILLDSGFTITKTKMLKIFHLPVKIVLANH